MAWRSGLSEDRNDIREVIPKFYYLPDFLTNSNLFVLGEWWSDHYLTDQLPSTIVLLNTWPIVFIFTNSDLINTGGQ